MMIMMVVVILTILMVVKVVEMIQKPSHILQKKCFVLSIKIVHDGVKDGEGDEIDVDENHDDACDKRE